MYGKHVDTYKIFLNEQTELHSVQTIKLKATMRNDKYFSFARYQMCT